MDDSYFSVDWLYAHGQEPDLEAIDAFIAAHLENSPAPCSPDSTEESMPAASRINDDEEDEYDEEEGPRDNEESVVEAHRQPGTEYIDEHLDSEEDSELDPDDDVQEEYELKPGEYEVYEADGTVTVKQGDIVEDKTEPQLSDEVAKAYAMCLNTIAARLLANNTLEYMVREEDLRERDKIPIDDAGASFAFEVGGENDCIEEITELCRDQEYFKDRRVKYWRFGDFYQGQKNVEVRAIAEDKLDKLSVKHGKTHKQVLEILGRQKARRV